MAPAGSMVTPEHLSDDLTTSQTPPPGGVLATRASLRGGQTLASLVGDLEREVIRDTLARHRGNISETARFLGLTRRGHYLKMSRLGLDNPIPPIEVNT
jgi:DNA-binding NtrC family response regulator